MKNADSKFAQSGYNGYKKRSIPMSFESSFLRRVFKLALNSDWFFVWFLKYDWLIWKPSSAEVITTIGN